MKMYTTLMTAYGVSAGIDFKFGGTVANTMDAHRVIQHFQEEKGPEVADRIINCKFIFQLVVVIQRARPRGCKGCQIQAVPPQRPPT
jgi:hypothetical protein